MKLEKAIANFDVRRKGIKSVRMSVLQRAVLQIACCKTVQKRCLRSMWDEDSWIGNCENDPRVVCMEKTNIRYVTPEDLGEAN